MSAATDLLEELAHDHRTAQTRIGAQVSLQTIQSFSLLDIEFLDKTFPLWRDVVARIVRDGRSASARLAADYIDVVKKTELGGNASANVTLADTLSMDQLTGNLLVAGPGSIKKALSKGTSLDEAIINAKTRSAGAAERLALDGGRRTILSDKQVVTYARVCSGKPCAFCAMLASRGPVYRSKESAGFLAHNSCRCMPVPSYLAGKRQMFSQAKEFRKQWNETTKGYSGATTTPSGGSDALNAFRRSWNPTDFT